MTSYKRRSHSVGSSITDHVIQKTLESLNTPRSLAVWMLYKYKEHDQLIQLEVDPLNYTSSSSFRDDLCATSLLSKADFLSTSVDRRSEALLKFLKSEELCRLTNLRVLPFLEGGSFPPHELHVFVEKARRKIGQILGKFDALELFEDSGWGPGVSTLLKGETSVTPNKYQYETGITRQAFDIAWPFLNEAYPSWWNEILSKISPTIEGGNVVTTVPKNSKTDRVIAIEPGWNLWFQKGLGQMIRRRLLRYGCNLNSQVPNQNLARVAFSRQLATVDFSSASDTIARKVCQLLLPPRWFTVMEIFRSHCGNLDGRKLLYEKFSSMGNGFTFELESMIFYSCALACCTADEYDSVSVFGDDVILPAHRLPSFHELVAALGFVVNTKKSFSSGCYYESCGSHFFKGSEVKPFFLRRKIQKVWDLYLYHNNVMDYAAQCLAGAAVDSRFRGLVIYLRELTPSEYRFLVPRHLGAVGFSSNFDDARPSVVRQLGFKVPCLTTVAQRLPFDGYGLVLDRIKAISTSEIGVKFQGPSAFPKAEGNLVPIKSRVKRRKSKVLVSFGQWHSFGDWV